MQHFQQAFSETNGTLLEDVGFDRLLPAGNVVSGVKAVYQSGGGQMGSVETGGLGSIYRSADGTNGQRDYRLYATLTYLNAAGAARKAGIGVRVSGDGEEGYFAVVDSALGAPVVYLYRLRAGVFVELASSPVTAAPLDAADLNGGIVLEVSVTTEADAVRLVVRERTTETVWFDHRDTDEDRLESWGFPAIYFGPTCTDDDVRFDDLTAIDFEEDAEIPAALEEGIVLVVNGQYYAEYQWKDLGVDVLWAKQSFVPAGPVAQLASLKEAHELPLKAGDRVGIILDGVWLAEGVLRKVDQDFAAPEVVTYELIGARQLGAEVPIRDPGTGGGVLGFNQDDDSQLYAAGRQGKDTGEQLAAVWDGAADGDDGLRVRGAAPATGPLYVQAELDNLDLELPRVAASGNVLQAEETLIGYMPEHGIFLDPETRQRRIIRRDTAELKVLPLSTLHAVPRIATAPDMNRAAVIVRGTFEESEEQTFVWENGGANSGPTSMQALWQTELQKTIEDNKKWIAETAYTILGFGLEGSNLYVTLDLSNVEMAANEWRGCDLIFYSGAQLANVYRIKSNTVGGKVVLTATAWGDEGAPSVGDSVGLRSAEEAGGLPNGYDDVGRAFALPDGKTIAGGMCGDATITTRKGDRTRSYTVKTRRQTYIDPDTGTQKERIKLARTGVVIFDPEKDLSVPTVVAPNLCGQNPSGDIGLPDSVSITLTVNDPTNPRVPEIRVPEKGWEGTCFSFDTARWGTGRGPGVGDIGVMTPHVIEDSNLTNLALQGTEYTAYAQHVLNALSPLARQGSVVIHGLDTQYAGLNYRVQITDDSRDLPGLDDATDLWPMEVTFDFREDTVTIAFGTMAAATDLRLDVYRQRFAEKTRLDVYKTLRRRMEELGACMAQSQRGGGAVGDASPTATPSCNVMHSDSSGKGKPLSEVVEDDLKPKSCSIDSPPRTCHEADCSAILGEQNIDKNAQHVVALMNAASGKSLATILCGLAAHLPALWSSYGGVLVSHDKELHKALTDLANVRVAGADLAACVNIKVDALCGSIDALNVKLDNFIDWVVNTAVPTLQACLAQKVDGPGDTCPVEPYVAEPFECSIVGNCDFTFTETVCEDPCKQVIPDVASGIASGDGP